MFPSEPSTARRRTAAARGAVLTVVALVLAACSRGEGLAGLTSAEKVAEAFGCIALEQVSTVPHTPDEYTCSSAGHPVLIYRADADTADAVRQHLDEVTGSLVAQVSDEWYVACDHEPTCTAIEHDLDVTFG